MYGVIVYYMGLIDKEQQKVLDGLVKEVYFLEVFIIMDYVFNKEYQFKIIFLLNYFCFVFQNYYMEFYVEDFFLDIRSVMFVFMMKILVYGSVQKGLLNYSSCFVGFIWLQNVWLLIVCCGYYS